MRRSHYTTPTWITELLDIYSGPKEFYETHKVTFQGLRIGFIMTAGTTFNNDLPAEKTQPILGVQIEKVKMLGEAWDTYLFWQVISNAQQARTANWEFDES